MKASFRISVLLALVSVWDCASAQLFVSAAGGTTTFTDDFALQSYKAPDDVGLVGRIGIQMSVLDPRFRLGAEYEITTIQQTYFGPSIWCGRSPYYQAAQGFCSKERANLRSLNLRMLWTLTDLRARFQPYVSFGTGWTSIPVHYDRETLGPKTDLGLGLAFDAIGSGLVQVAIEPRYTFFYFLERMDGIDPGQVSLTASTRVRLWRW